MNESLLQFNRRPFTKVSSVPDFLRKQSDDLRVYCAFALDLAGVWRYPRGSEVCSARQRRGLLTNKIISMPTPYRPAKSALDEFLPERSLGFDVNREFHIDPQDVDLEPLQFSAESSEPLRIAAAQEQSRVEWWPMFAAALIGLGVSLLAFGAWARFGDF